MRKGKRNGGVARERPNPVVIAAVREITHRHGPGRRLEERKSNKVTGSGDGSDKADDLRGGEQ